jgi:tetratricopeptide (TPR) repeat protein
MKNEQPRMNNEYFQFSVVRSSLFIVCCLCLCGSTLAAALDPEVKEPYRLHVVLHVAANRLLTPVFKDQLKRELGDSLQAALGKMGTVEVVDEHPLLKDIEKNGLQQALDAFAGKERIKTHFVLIDYVDGQYEVQTAQHDGLTGLTTPVVRLARTPDPAGRPFVARLAARLVDRDFGLVGTVTKILDGGKVEVTVKGSRLGTPLDRWLAKNDVFAVARLTRTGAGERTARLDESFLQVVEGPKDGVCVCRFFNRYQTNKLTEGAGVLGYRCLKLGTSSEGVPLRLRLVDARGQPQDGLQIEVSQYGFEKSDKFKNEGTTRDGLVQTEERYHHAAFVRVLHAGALIAQVPVPVIESRTVVCRVSVSDQGGVVGLLNSRKRTCIERLTETLLVQDDLRKELGELMSKGKLDAALARARTGLKGLDADIGDLASELNAVSVQAQNLPANTRFSLTEGQQRLGELRTAREELHKHIGELEETVKKLQKDTKHKELETQVLLARNLRREAKYDEAIKSYEEALAKLGANPSLQKELDELKTAWQIKGKEHAQARAFIYDTWPKLDRPFKIREQLGEVRKAFEVCKEAGDKLTVQKLVLVNIAHDDRLNKQLKALRPDDEDDRRSAEIIEQVAGELRKLHQEALAFLGIKAEDK